MGDALHVKLVQNSDYCHCILANVGATPKQQYDDVQHRFSIKNDVLSVLLTPVQERHFINGNVRYCCKILFVANFYNFVVFLTAGCVYLCAITC